LKRTFGGTWQSFNFKSEERWLNCKGKPQ